MYTVDSLDSFIFLKVLSQICRKTNGSIRYIIKNINYLHVNFVKDWLVPLVPWMVQALSVAGFIKLVHSLGPSSERSQVSTWERSHLSSSEQSELEGWDHGILPDVFVSSQTCLVNFIVCLGLCNNKR